MTEAELLAAILDDLRLLIDGIRDVLLLLIGLFAAQGLLLGVQVLWLFLRGKDARSLW